MALTAAVPAGEATDLVLDGGWQELILVSETQNTVGVSFSLSAPAWFRITDCCQGGDVFSVTDVPTGELLFNTIFQAFPTGFGDGPFPESADEGWTGIEWSSFERLFDPGDYRLNITGETVVLYPAALFVRLDSVVGVIPLPAALPLLAGGLAMFGLLGWRRRV